MDADKIRQLLQNLQTGEIDLDQALEGLRSLPYEETELPGWTRTAPCAPGCRKWSFASIKPHSRLCRSYRKCGTPRARDGNTRPGGYGSFHPPELTRCQLQSDLSPPDPQQRNFTRTATHGSLAVVVSAGLPTWRWRKKLPRPWNS